MNNELKKGDLLLKIGTNELASVLRVNKNTYALSNYRSVSKTTLLDSPYYDSNAYLVPTEEQIKVALDTQMVDKLYRKVSGINNQLAELSKTLKLLESNTYIQANDDFHQMVEELLESITDFVYEVKKERINETD